MMSEKKALMVMPYEDIKSMAAVVAKSGLFKAQNPHQILTLMLLCQARGLHPVNAMMQYDIIDGKPSMKAVTMLALFRQSGGRVKIIERSSKRAAIHLTASNGDEGEFEFTIDDARKAGLTNKRNWQMYPKAMLWSRVISDGIRAMAGEITSGIYTPEEIENFDAYPATTEQPKDEPPADAEDAEILDDEIGLDDKDPFTNPPGPGPEKPRTRAKKDEPTKAMWGLMHSICSHDEIHAFALSKGHESSKQLTRAEVQELIDKTENPQIGAYDLDSDEADADPAESEEDKLKAAVIARIMQREVTGELLASVRETYGIKGKLSENSLDALIALDDALAEAERELAGEDNGFGLE